MLNSKDRKTLRALANPIEAIFQIGKSGLSDNLIKQLDDALKARQLIKLSVLQNAEIGVREAAEALAEALSADVVDCLGRRIILYRAEAEKAPLI